MINKNLRYLALCLTLCLLSLNLNLSFIYKTPTCTLISLNQMDYKEGDRVQYKIDLSKEAVSEGTIQKVLKGGESLRESVEKRSSSEKKETIPRYVNNNYPLIHLYLLDY